MLEAAPGRQSLDLDDLAAAIDACLDAEQACTSCADSSVAEDDVAELRTCIGLCSDCADLCGTTARVLSRQLRYDELLVHRLLQACVRACSSCAEECARHADHHDHCRICAETCGACELACRRLLDAEAFQDLQALAGG
jgi:uncharacterized protein DUF326